jgi:hypothetical protein
MCKMKLRPISGKIMTFRSMANRLFARMASRPRRSTQSLSARALCEPLEGKTLLSAPYLTNFAGYLVVDEGASFNMSVDARDDDGDAINVLVDWMDGSPVEYYYDVGSFPLSHTFPDGTAMAPAQYLQMYIWDNTGEDTYYDAVPVYVNNIAPSATITQQATDDGQTFTVSLVDANDPSLVDKNAGFHYSFNTDFDSLATSYAAATDPSSKIFSFESPADSPVWVRIFDKDGGFRNYSASIQVPDLAAVAVSTSQSNRTRQDDFTGETAWRFQWSTNAGQIFNDYPDQRAGSGTSTNPVLMTFPA